MAWGDRWCTNDEDPPLVAVHAGCGRPMIAELRCSHCRGLVIREAFFGIRRFDDLQRRLAIATNILAQRLERLTDHGVLERVPYQHQPLRHEYRLTEGRQLQVGRDTIDTAPGPQDTGTAGQLREKCL